MTNKFKKYQSKKTGEIRFVISTDEEAKKVNTVDEKMDNEKAFSISTLKRWWKLVEDETTEDETTEEPKQEQPKKESKAKKDAPKKEAKAKKEPKAKKVSLINEVMAELEEELKLEIFQLDTSCKIVVVKGIRKCLFTSGIVSVRPMVATEHELAHSLKKYNNPFKARLELPAEKKELKAYITKIVNL